MTVSRSLNKLTVTQAKAKTKPGRYSDGGGLYLRVLKNGAKAWTLRLKANGRDREIGLGAFKDVGLADARERAEQYRSLVKSGIDPLAPKPEIIKKTFLDCVNIFLETKEAGWKNKKHCAQWRMTLMKYAEPLHLKVVGDITTPDILKILQPMWLSKHETASRLRGRIEAVLDYAKAMGWRSGENPALWRGNLKLLLPAYSKAKNIEHHAAVPFEQMPNFMNALNNRKATVARLLEFIILTTARSGEARFADWSEIDINSGTWTVPANRMKMGKEHSVPLNDRAREILLELGEFADTGIIFQHPTRKVAYSVNATRALLKRMGYGDYTTHGFRSTFRDWAGDKTLHQRETIEAALAHGIKDKAEAAYRRSSSFEKRQHLMQDWAKFLMQSEVKGIKL